MGKRIQSNHRFTTRHLCRTHLAIALASLCPAAASAGITTTGDVSPDPATTTIADDLFIRGTMTVDAGSDVLALDSYIGRRSDDVSVATISGSGSTWINHADLTLGYGGSNATLNILEGGYVSSFNNDIAFADQAVVAGADSRWEMSGFLRLTGGSASIGAGGSIAVTDGILIGKTPFGSSTINAIQRTSTITVDGFDAKLIASGQLDVGSTISSYGDVDYGVLNLSNGGLAVVEEDTWVGRRADTGTINFNAGTLTTGGFFASAENLTGAGTVNVNGVVSDLNLLFNQTQGVHQQVVLSDLPGQSITFNLDIDGSAAMGAGYSGGGSIEIREGITIASSDGFLAYQDNASASSTVDGAGSAWNLSANLYIGRLGDASMTVSNGGSVDSAGLIIVADLRAATGELNVTGNNSSVQANDLIVGQVGQGTLDILDGASVTVDNDMWVAMSKDDLTPSLRGQGEVLIDGSGSQLIVGGHLMLRRWGDVARMDVTNGGLFQAGSAELRDTVVVDGVGSQMNIIGHLDAIDLLDIKNGAHVTSASLTASGTPISVVGIGTQLNVTGLSTISSTGFGVASGAQYTTGSLNHTQGQLRVTGAGTLLDIEGDLTQTAGNLQVLSGGTLKNANATIDGSARVDIRIGELWSIDGNLRIGETGDALVNHYSGTVDVLSGDLILSRYTAPVPIQTDDVVARFIPPPPGKGTYNLSGGLLNLHGNDILLGAGEANFNFTAGMLQNVGNFVGDLTQQGGTLAPGNSPGQTTIQGNYTLQRGALEIELEGSTTAGVDYDQLAVIGEVDLIGADALSDGQLDLTLGFAAAIGDSFTILDNDGSDAITGAFAQGTSISTMYAGAEYLFGIDYAGGTGNDIVLTVSDVILSLLLGDADGDGDVDAFDITAVEQHFGNTGDPGGTLLGDADGDGDVDAFDITAVEQNFGNTLPASVSLSAASIPEPSSLLLLGVGGLLLTRRHRSACKNV